MNLTSIWSSSPSSRALSTAGVLQFLLRLTAREELHGLIAGAANKLGPWLATLLANAFADVSSPPVAAGAGDIQTGQVVLFHPGVNAAQEF